jgi:gas vesicle protein
MEHEELKTIFMRLFPELQTQVENILRQEGNDVSHARVVAVRWCLKELSHAKDYFQQCKIEAIKAKCRRMSLCKRSEAIQQEANALRESAQALAAFDFSSLIDQAQNELLWARATQDVEAYQRAQLKSLVYQVQSDIAPAVATILEEVAAEIEKLQRLALSDMEMLRELLRIARQMITANGVGADWISEQDLAIATQPLISRLKDIEVGRLSQIQNPEKWIQQVVSEVKDWLPPPPTLASMRSPEQLASLVDFVAQASELSIEERWVWGMRNPLLLIEQPDDLDLPIDRLNGNIQRFSSSPYDLVIRVCTWAPLPALRGFKEWLDADREMRSVFGGLVAHSAEPWRAADQDWLIGNGFLPRADSPNDKTLHTNAITMMINNENDGLALERD